MEPAKEFTLDPEAIQRDMDWAKLFNYEVQKDFLRYCIYSISQNDPAHNLGHVWDVCSLGKDICERMGLSDRDRLLVYMGCLLHDIGCKFERKHHHVIGYGLTYELLTRYCPGMFTDDELLTIATAVLEHRSSNKTKPSNLISSVVSVADSGIPDFDLYIKRSLQLRMSQGDDEETLFEEVGKHLINKFGVEGYHWISYPDIGMDFFKHEWEIFSNKLYDDKYAMGKIREMYALLRG